MSVSRKLAAAAAVLVTTLATLGTAGAQSFPIAPAGQCPSCYVKECEAVGGRPRCECNPVPETGTATPSYYVTHVVYAPPGKSSSVSYAQGSKSGTTTSVTSSFKQGTTVTGSGSVGDIFEGSGIKASSGSAWGNSVSGAVDITVENTSTRAVAGKVDVVDHGDDEIWFLVKPRLDVTVWPERTCSRPYHAQWAFARNQTQSGASFLYLRWLLNPQGMNGLPANVRADLNRFGITEADFPELVKAHPFATFNLKPSHSGQCLAIPAGSQQIGEGAIQYPCLGPAVTDQGFRLVSLGGDLVQIVASHSDQCLAVPAGSQNDGQQVIQYPCLGAGVTDQSWRLVRKPGGQYQIKAVHSGKCLAVPASSQIAGQGVIQYECLGGAQGVPDQLWSLAPSSFQRPTIASMANGARPGDANRFEFVKRFAYVPAQPGQTPDTITDVIKREVTNTRTRVEEKSRTVNVTFSGGVKFDGLIKAGLSHEKTMTWTDQTSTKQSDTASTTHTIKVGQPSSGFGGSTFLNVYHDKLWKTYVFLLDSNF